VDEALDKNGEGKAEEVAGAIGKSRYVEFENGSHSEIFLVLMKSSVADLT
jgi:hypothetical protein